jgi:hypothetical protein
LLAAANRALRAIGSGCVGIGEMRAKITSVLINWANDMQTSEKSQLNVQSRKGSWRDKLAVRGLEPLNGKRNSA